MFKEKDYPFLFLPKGGFIIKFFKYAYSLVFILSFFIIIIFVPFISDSSFSTFFESSSSINTNSKIFGTNSYLWPLPNNSYISSYFGRRNSPTAYASSFHKGIDIPAEPGTGIYAVGSGTVTLAKFNGSGGCTICITDGFLTYTYCHVSPTFIVCPGQKVTKGDLIAYVGPKNVYGFSENRYKDSQR